jgi:TusA-related sulfurtransferase
MTTHDITLDVRGMEPPEPLEKVLQTIEGFAVGDRLKLVIDCRPQPLFRILERSGFAYREEAGAESRYEITIWRRPPPG